LSQLWFLQVRMKSQTDPRHQRRRMAVKELFAQSFSKQIVSSSLAKKVLKNLKSIDKKISKSAPAWPLEKLNKIDLAILRLAVYELTQSEAPPKVIIDESVELAKEYGSDNSAGFVNGVLGDIYKTI